MRGRPMEHRVSVLRVISLLQSVQKTYLSHLDTSSESFLDTLDRQCSNQSRTYTASIFSRQDLYLIPLALRPSEDLTQSLCTTSFEVWVFVKHRPISADVAGGVVLLLADGGDTAGGKAGSAGANEFS